MSGNRVLVSADPYLHVAPCLAHHPYWRPLYLLTVQRSQQERLLSTALSLHSSHMLVSSPQYCSLACKSPSK